MVRSFTHIYRVTQSIPFNFTDGSGCFWSKAVLCTRPCGDQDNLPFDGMLTWINARGK